MADDAPPRSYDYARRKGVRDISWEEFGALSRRLAEVLDARKIEVVLGIARGGLFPATAVAAALRCELFPTRITRRANDEVVYETPVWKVPVVPDVKGKSVAVVDDVVDTGETLQLVAAELRRLGARRIATAALIAHTWAQHTTASITCTEGDGSVHLR